MTLRGVVAPVMTTWAFLTGHRLTIEDGRIIKRRWWKVETIELADLAEIKFHYHAVVGFVCVWEFVTKSGVSLDHGAVHIDRGLLTSLERAIPGFAQADFDRRFEEGDVEDTVEVWQADSEGRQ
jgi:hypothetical protein